MGNVVSVFEASYPILLPGVLELHRGGTLRRVCGNCRTRKSGRMRVIFVNLVEARTELSVMTLDNRKREIPWFRAARVVHFFAFITGEISDGFVNWDVPWPGHQYQTIKTE